MILIYSNQINLIQTRSNTFSNFTFMTQQVISLHLGQAGINIGNACWQLFCYDHYINPQGFSDHFFQNQYLTEKKMKSTLNFFQETSLQRFVPRCLFIDTDSNANNRVRKGSNQKLFHDGHFISGKSDASGIFARGKYQVGSDTLEMGMNRVRKLVEGCQSLQGFMIYNSINGGTGSGFYSLLMESIKEQYGQSQSWNFNVYPSMNHSQTCIEPYNSVLTTTTQIEHFNIVVPLQNQVVSNICLSKLGLDIPTHLQINRLIAQLISSVTSSLRLDIEENHGGGWKMSNYAQQLAPISTLHFLQTSRTPFYSLECCYANPRMTEELTEDIFQKSHMFTDCSPRDGKYIAGYLKYRGDAPPKYINQGVTKLKEKTAHNFVDWVPVGYKISLDYQGAQVFPGGDLSRTHRELTSLLNHTSIKHLFSRMRINFNKLYSKKAFLHWFLRDGIEELEFITERDALIGLEEDNKQAEIENVDQNDQQMKEN